ncbi:MAG: hypothetical protein QM622_00275, partial [Microbacterium sp.]
MRDDDFTLDRNSDSGYDSGEALRLPAVPAAPVRPAVPVLTAIVPVAGAIVLWRLTGSIHTLWFAALGPLLAGAAFADGLRTSRRTVR